MPTLTISAHTVRNHAIAAPLPTASASVAAGGPLASAFEASGRFPRLMTDLIRTGEQTGDLTGMLQELASLYEAEAERAVGAAVKLLEPVLILGMGMVVSAIVGAVMLPVLTLNGAGDHVESFAILQGHEKDQFKCSLHLRSSTRAGTLASLMIMDRSSDYRQLRDGPANAIVRC